MCDQLPTGDKLAQWNVTQDVKCALCGGTQTLNHVLSACTEALGSGTYTWIVQDLRLMQKKTDPMGNQQQVMTVASWKVQQIGESLLTCQI